MVSYELYRDHPAGWYPARDRQDVKRHAGCQPPGPYTYRILVDTPMLRDALLEIHEKLESGQTGEARGALFQLIGALSRA